MTFSEYLSLKHYALIIGWPLLSYAGSPMPFESVPELAGALVGGPLVVLGLVYIWYSLRHKQSATASPE